MRTTAHGAIALLTIVLLGVAAWKLSRRDTLSSSEALARTIRKHEAELSHYVSQLLEGKIAKDEGLDSFPPPNIENMKPGILSVSLDGNTNIYFVTDNSWGDFQHRLHLQYLRSANSRGRPGTSDC